MSKHQKPDGHKVKNSSGYVIVKASSHPHATKNGYVYEHRLVMERRLGRYLRRDEQVHHINGIKDDNRPENLEVLNHLIHRLKHRKPDSDLRMPGEGNQEIQCACGCGQILLKYDELGRPRSCMKGHQHRGHFRDVLKLIPYDGIRAKELAKILGRPYLGVLGTLQKLRDRGLIIRDWRKWKRI